MRSRWITKLVLCAASSSCVAVGREYYYEVDSPEVAISYAPGWVFEPPRHRVESGEAVLMFHGDYTQVLISMGPAPFFPVIPAWPLSLLWYAPLPDDALELHFRLTGPDGRTEVHPTRMVLLLADGTRISPETNPLDHYRDESDEIDSPRRVFGFRTTYALPENAGKEFELLPEGILIDDLAPDFPRLVLRRTAGWKYIIPG